MLPTMRDRPLIGVGAVVFKGPDVLLIRRGKPPAEGAWSLPGGAQELGETTRQTALRELLEETGVSARILGLLDVVDYIERDRDGRPLCHYTLVDWLCAWQSGAPRPGDDALDAAWFPPATLATLDLWDETRRVIEEGARRMGAEITSK